MSGEPGHDGVDNLVRRDRETRAVRMVDWRKSHAANDDCVRASDGQQLGFVFGAGLTHPGQRGRVVEANAQHLRHLDDARDAANASHEVGAPVAARHEVGHLNFAGFGHPTGHEHERVALVVSARACVRTHWGDVPMTVIVVAQKAREHRGGIEARHT